MQDSRVQRRLFFCNGPAGQTCDPGICGRSYASRHAGGFPQEDHGNAAGDQFYRRSCQGSQKRREQQTAGEWIEGWGYDEQGLLEKRSPTRYDLDRGCSDSPVSIMRTCAHIRCVNSMALKLAGIDRNTPDPPGGEIERDENGEPTGSSRRMPVT